MAARCCARLRSSPRNSNGKDWQMTELTNITKDAAYDAVDPKDFRSMMDVERYGARSTALDKIISAPHDHFWDPLDPKYIDFSAPFDLENEYIMPPFLNLDLQTAIGERLNEKQKIQLVNASSHWGMSSILPGAQ